MSEHADDVAEDDPACHGRGRAYAVGFLCLALLAAAVGLGVVVGSWPPPDPPPAAAAPSTTPPQAPAVVPRAPLRQPLRLPDFRGRTVAEASAAAEAAGGTPVILDARWNRPVAPDWIVCTSGEPTRGDDVPSGDFDIAAVPAGDPCP